jgi:hypothetical protein
MGRDRKYGDVSTTEGFIPSDEPVFMLRARDICSVETIAYYLAQCVEAGSPRQHLDLVLDAVDEFRSWQEAHEDDLKVPDSVRHGGMADA